MAGIRTTVIHAWAGVIGLAMLAGPALAASRVALVIGNSAYAHAPALANPLNDAADVGAALGRLGFTVTRLGNADQAALLRGLRAFRRKASASEIAVVFYAGHGIEVNKQNFLVPVDARLQTDGDVEYETVPLDLVMSAVAGASEFRLIVLDACRDNPFVASMRREQGSARSIGRGLARAEPTGGGTLLAYSAKEGTVALDGKGRNSPYTRALLRHLEEPGLEVGLMFRKVRDAVLESTGRSQEPFSYGSLTARGAYFVPPTSQPAGGGPTVTSSASAVGLAVEVEYWKTINRIDDSATRLAALLDYKAKFPAGVYADLASIQIESLRKRTVSGGSRQELSSEAVEAGLGLTRDDRRRIQRALTAEGFRPGRPDGLFGRRTRTAIAGWQAARGAKPTGFLDAGGVKELLAAAPKAVRGPSVGKRFRDCPACLELVVVPPGSFMMGSRSAEIGRSGDEGPVHRVTIGEAFAVGVYEVTFAQWDACRLDRGCMHNPGDRNWRRSTRPVIYVNWNDAREYVGWLSRKTGHRYRLLSESEWEYVARAGTKTPFHYGSTISTVQANYNGNYAYGSGRKGRFRKQTMLVGSFPANAFGLRDVHGNVREWVEDCRHREYKGAPADGSAWSRGGDCSRRVLRGGSWSNRPRNLRSAFRIAISAEFRFDNVGFRVARTLD